jgi:glutaredoxin
MKTIIATALALAFAAPPLGAAQLYRWVDEKGNVEWRDTPPPPNAKKVEQRTVGSNTIQTSDLPYSTQQAVKNHPVTLWAFNCGAPCDQARAHLTKRGVPYTERNAEKEHETFKKLTGSSEVPVLFVGTRQVKGYLDTEWDSALDSAGYPKTAIPGTKTKQAKPAPESSAKASGETAPKAPAK